PSGHGGSPATALATVILHRGAGRKRHFAAGATPHLAPYQERETPVETCPQDQPKKGTRPRLPKERAMHTHSTAPWQHSHVFLGEKHEHHERRTWLVVALTAATMVVEVVGGTIFGSMAVVADGVHMSTHVAALSIAALAYWVARRHAGNARFA